jgi:tetratricopeptide (TPR) repeat protein
LLGVTAECELESLDDSSVLAARRPVAGESNNGIIAPNPRQRIQLAARRALNHYGKFLMSHPNSYWAHYRAAALSYGLGTEPDVAVTTKHLRECLHRRPNNPMLHSHMAVSLMTLNQHRDAQKEIEIAIDGAPDLAEFHRTRARLRATLGQTAGLADDLYNFELLKKVLPRMFWELNGADFGPSDESSAFGASPFSSPFGVAAGRRARGSARGATDIEPEEVADRADLATAIRRAGELELAEAELGKILVLDPKNIGVRLTRAAQALDAKRFDDASRDFEAVIHDLNLAAYAREELAAISRSPDQAHDSVIKVLRDASDHFCCARRADDAMSIARRALDLAIELDQPRGECHYALARAYAISGRIGATEIKETAHQLYFSFLAHPLYKYKYEQDTLFNPVRGLIDLMLQTEPDPIAERARRLAATSSRKGR